MRVVGRRYAEDIDFLASQDFMKILDGKTIVITGATGMLASYIIRVLLKYNDTEANVPCNIVAVCRNKERISSVFGEFAGTQKIRFIISDVCDCLIPEIQNVDYVIHMAGSSNPKDFFNAPVETIRPNVMGTDNILRQLVGKTKINTFMFVSSASVYGANNIDEMDENLSGMVQFYNSANSYAESKRMGENIVFSYYKEYGVPVKIVRPFHMYGPGMRLDNESFLGGGGIGRAIKKQDVILKSDGKTVRNCCYLRDTIWQMLFVLTNGKIGEIYNIGNEQETHTISELAEIIAEIFGNGDVHVRYCLESNITNPSNRNNMNPSLKKIKALFGEKSIRMIGLEEGLTRLRDDILNVRDGNT